jgi:pre-mRNA-splicing factor CDC5/CEF1
MEDIEDEDKRKERKGTSASIVDAEDILKKQRERQRAEEDTAYRLRSEVLRRELPRPYQVNTGFSKLPKEIEVMKGKENDLEIASELIKAEMVTMMTKDAIDFPSKSIKPPNKKNIKYDKFTESELKSARKILDTEVEELEKAHGIFSYKEYESTFIRCAEDLIYLPHLKKFSLMSLPQTDDYMKTRALQFQYESVKSDLDKQAKKSKNIVNHLQVYLGGYQKVTVDKEKNIHELQKQIAEARIELSVFKSLKEKEEKSIPIRLEALKSEVEKQRSQENLLQIRFANLVNRKNKLIEQRQPIPTQ